jgi:uncharacterized damage-inducible protein DinB
MKKSYLRSIALEKRTSIVNDISNQILAEFGSLTNEQLNWKPHSNMWSIAQNLEHVIIINESYYPVFTSLKTGTYKTPFIAKFSFLVRFLGNTILKSVQPDRQKKMKTFPIWEPSTSTDIVEILQRFNNHQNELIQKIDEVKEFIEQGCVISSPANRNIVYTLETALDIIVAHEQRHIEQAKEVLQQLKVHSIYI